MSLTLIVFAPAMFGLILGLSVGRDAATLLLLLPLTALIFMVTAVTYQFQGWLAALMVNQRRRRTIMVAATVALVLISQAPQLFNLATSRRLNSSLEARTKVLAVEEELRKQLQAGSIDVDEFKVRIAVLTNENENENATARDHQLLAHIEPIADVVNLVFPPGWMALGAKYSAIGVVWPALFGALGMTLIGAGSLVRGYRTIYRLQTGQFTSNKKTTVVVAKSEGKPLKRSMLELDLPWLSEEVAAIALGGFRSLTRAPEAKMILLMPAIMAIVAGVTFYSRSANLSEMAKPFMMFAGMSIILLSMVQLTGNQFGFDRAGFRVFVLCAASRRDILLGKNLSIAPLALGLGFVVAGAIQIISPMRIDRFLTVVPQFVSMYLLFCLITNFLSMYGPMPVSAGSIKPTNAKLVPFILHVASVFVFPIVVGPTLIPIVVELVLEWMGVARGWPIGLGLTFLECVAVVWAYLVLLKLQGQQLQSREKAILEIVTTKAE